MELLDAMTRYARTTHGAPSGVVVTGYREMNVESGYCETCHDWTTSVLFDCTDAAGETWTYYLNEDLGWLVRELTADPAERRAALDSARRYDWDGELHARDDDLPFDSWKNTWARGRLDFPADD